VRSAFSRAILSELVHLGGVGTRAREPLLGDLLEPRLRGHAADRGDEIGGRQPDIGHHAEIDRRAPGKARGVESDRDQARSGGRALAVAVAEVQEYVGLAGIAHVAQLRSDIERVPGGEGLRPEPERA
jgi:hypothetical protein